MCCTCIPANVNESTDVYFYIGKVDEMTLHCVVVMYSVGKTHIRREIDLTHAAPFLQDDREKNLYE